MNITASIKPDLILANCTVLNPLDDNYINHPIIERFGSPSQPIYVDQCNVDIDGVTYDNPLILPIVNGQLNLVQCAVLQDGQRVQVMPDGLAKGFARYGHFDHAKPVIITYDLEAFFKVAQTGYAVVLVILPTLCNANKRPLRTIYQSNHDSFYVGRGYLSFQDTPLSDTAHHLIYKKNSVFKKKLIKKLTQKLKGKI